RQDDHPLAVVLVLHAIDLPDTFGLRILRQHAHDTPLLLPWAVHLETGNMRRWRRVDHLGEGLFRGGEELEQPHSREQAVERRVKAREDEPAHAIADEERVFA